MATTREFEERAEEIRGILIKGGKTPQHADEILKMAILAYCDAIMALEKVVEETPDFALVFPISLEMTSMRCREMMIEFAVPSAH